MRKIISIILAAIMLLAMTTVFAETKTNRAILLCYDNDGRLVYSNLLNTEDGVIDAEVPAQYDDTKKKIYFVDTAEFKDIEAVIAEPSATETPAASAEPEPTGAPSAAPTPSATAKPAATPNDTPYEKAADAMNAPAVVMGVEMSVDSDNNEVYSLTVLYHGREVKVDVEKKYTIRTAPEEYAFMVGREVGSLEKGDVVCMTANLSGKIRTVDFLFRPTEEDIITGGTDYGVNFEKLYALGGKVANTWNYYKYGQNPTSDRFQYAFGVVARMKGGTLTLLNKSGAVDDALDIDIDPKAYVYTCDVNGKEYEIEIASANDIRGTISQKELNKDVADLNGDYSYNYALVRIVDGTATDVVVYENYNDN